MKTTINFHLCRVDVKMSHGIEINKKKKKSYVFKKQHLYSLRIIIRKDRRYCGGKKQNTELFGR